MLDIIFNDKKIEEIILEIEKLKGVKKVTIKNSFSWVVDTRYSKLETNKKLAYKIDDIIDTILPGTLAGITSRQGKKQIEIDFSMNIL